MTALSQEHTLTYFNRSGGFESDSYILSKEIKNESLSRLYKSK